MPEPIPVGVVGTGGIFRNLHIPYFRDTNLANIVAVTDLDKKSAEEAASEFDAAVCDSCEDLIDRDEVQAVNICTHPRPHRDIAVAAARAGKHVLLEKPMCRTVAEANDMIEAARHNEVQLQVAYMMRFHPCMLKLKQLLDNGTLGDVVLVYRNAVGWFTPQHPWLFVKNESGGMLVEQSIHWLDAWLWLYGAIDSVFARTDTINLGGTYPDEQDAVENNAVFIATFANGASGMLIKSWAAEVGLSGDGMIGTKGSARYSQNQISWKTHDMTDEQSFAPDVPDDDSYRSVPDDVRQNRYWAMASKGRGIEHWLRCITGQQQTETSGEVGRAGIAVAEAAYRSAEKHETATVEY